jgi:hypothetical protein
MSCHLPDGGEREKEKRDATIAIERKETLRDNGTIGKKKMLLFQ